MGLSALLPPAVLQLAGARCPLARQLLLPPQNPQGQTRVSWSTALLPGHQERLGRAGNESCSGSLPGRAGI